MNTPDRITLTFAKDPTENEPAVMVVKAGPIPKGARIVATTLDGQFVASIRPFARNAQAGTNYTFSLEAGLVKNRELEVLFHLSLPGDAELRPVTAKEVISVTSYVAQSQSPK